MKVIITEFERSTIENFADAHNLTMIVNERDTKKGELSPYYAFFENTEAKEDKYSNVLCTEAGTGRTPYEAISRYAQNISKKYLVINAYSDTNRKEIQCPIFIEG
jgi:hypothetical protein